MEEDLSTTILNMSYEDFFKYDEKIRDFKLELPSEYLVKNYPDNYLEALKYKFVMEQ